MKHASKENSQLLCRLQADAVDLSLDHGRCMHQQKRKADAMHHPQTPALK
jgi:hypothetical protein